MRVRSGPSARTSSSTSLRGSWSAAIASTRPAPCHAATAMTVSSRVEGDSWLDDGIWWTATLAAPHLIGAARIAGMLGGAPVRPRRLRFDMGSIVRHSPKRDRRSAMASAGGEARPMAALTASEGVSRLLSLVFYVVAARTLTTEGFGVLRYTVGLALLIFALLAVLTTSVTREVGAARGNDVRTGEVLGSGLWVAALLVGVSSVVCVLASLLGLTGGASLLGLLAVGFTYTMFQLYYAISRGVGDASRAAIAYVCASAAQLILLVGLGALLDPSPGVALFAYGASSVLPVLAYELRRPLIRGRALSVRRVELDRIWRLSAPLVLAQAGFVVWFSVDQIWIESALTTEDVGLYGAAKTLSQVFLVLPAGVTGVLLPRVAELRTAGDAVRARRLVYWATVGSMLISSLLALAVVLPGTELLEAVYRRPLRRRRRLAHGARGGDGASTPAS